MKTKLLLLRLITLIVVMAAACSTQLAKAVIAYPKPIVFTQPDGDTLTITLQGDEYVKYAVSEDGYTLLYNDKGFFTYAQTDRSGQLEPSPFIARSPARREATERSFLQQTSRGLSFSPSQVKAFQQVKETVTRAAATGKQSAEAGPTPQRAFPTTGSRKLLCVLMAFKDKPFVRTKAEFNNLFNQVGYNLEGAVGSVKDYFQEASYGKLNLSVDVAGPFTASQNMAYYGNNSNGDGLALVKEGLAFANPSVNYADYDNDNDGVVDGVYMIFAGYGEEAGGGADCIWSHASWGWSPVTYDGKQINSYACSPELIGNSGSSITGIGVVCHEFGHTLGAPDFYDIDYGTGGGYSGTGSWDLQAGGSWNAEGKRPAHPNPYTKTEIYKWATVTQLTSTQNVSVAPAWNNNAAAFYKFSTTTQNEYFLVENRQQRGFDSALPGHGLMVYRVSPSVTSWAINSTHPQGFYPVSANAPVAIPSAGSENYGSINSSSCPWPGTGGKNRLSDITTPSLKSWAGANSAKTLANIAENSSTGTITFAYQQTVDDVVYTYSAADSLALVAFAAANPSCADLQTWVANKGWKEPWNSINSKGFSANWSSTNPMRLTHLKAYGYNDQITTLSTAAFTELKELNVSNNRIASLDLSANTKLERLMGSNNQVATALLPATATLTYIQLYSNQLTALDISKQTALTYLEIDNNQITAIDLSKAKSTLETLWLNNNKLNGGIPDFTGFTALKTLFISYVNTQTTGPKSIDLSHLSLQTLSIVGNSLTSLTLPQSGMTSVEVQDNQLTSLDLRSNTTTLLSLYMDNNPLTSLPALNNMPKLQSLSIRGLTYSSLDLTTQQKQQLYSLYTNYTSVPVIDCAVYTNLQQYGPPKGLSALNASASPDLRSVYAEGTNLRLSTITTNGKITSVRNGRVLIGTRPDESNYTSSEIPANYTADLSADATIGGQATVYQWYKNNSQVSVSPVAGQPGKFALNNQVGEQWYCRMTNPARPGWTFYTTQAKTIIAPLALTVAVTTAGTLKSQIEKQVNDLKTVTALTVSGPLNGTDMNTLRLMLGKDAQSNQVDGYNLSSINLAAASIVAGGESYNSNGVSGITTENNVLPRYLFANMRSLKTLVLPNSITRIASCACAWSGVTGDVVIPQGVVTIERDAFWNMGSVRSFSIPASVQQIVGEQAFGACWNLSQITVASGNSRYKAEQGVLFNFAKDTLFVYPQKATMTSYAVPEGVKYLSNYSFYFGGESNLATLSLPSTLTQINDNAFIGNRALSQITLHASNSSFVIDNGALLDKQKTRLILYPAAKEGNSYTVPATVNTIQTKAFAYSRPKEVILPPSVNSVEYSAFLNSSIETIALPDAVTTVESGMFESAQQLRKATLGNKVSTIFSRAFYNCTALDSIVSRSAVPPAVNDAQVFYNVNKATCKVIVPVGSKAAYQAAAHWKEFKNIIEEGTQPQGLTYSFNATTGVLTISGNGTTVEAEKVNEAIGRSSSGTENTTLKQVDFSGASGIISIGNNAFNSCYSLTGNIILPNTVQTIGATAFASSKITSITIPSVTSSIGDYAFNGCRSLASFNVSTDNNYFKSTDGVLFSKDGKKLIQYPNAKGTAYSIPEGTITIGHYAISNNDRLTTVTIPSSLASFEQFGVGGNYYPFANCTALASFNVAQGNTFLKSVDGVLYSYSGNKLWYYPQKKAGTSYTVLPGTVTIGNAAFASCRQLTSFTLPEGLTTIEGYAFSGLYGGVRSITLPTSLTAIGQYAFSSCDSMKTVTYKGTTEPTIGDKAFANGPSTRTLYVPNATTGFGTNTNNKWGATTIVYGPQHLAGDANNDGRVNVIDVVATVNYIMGKNPTPFNFSAADLNADGTINISDVVGIVGIVMQPDVVKTRAMMQGSADICIDGGRVTMESNVSLGGFDIVYDGSLRPTAALRGFTVAEYIKDGKQHLIGYTLNGALEAGVEQLFTIDGSIDLDQSLFVDGSGVEIVTRSVVPTSINSPNESLPFTLVDGRLEVNGNVKRVEIYSTSGALMLSSRQRSVDLSVLPRAVYVIRIETAEGTISQRHILGNK